MSENYEKLMKKFEKKKKRQQQENGHNEWEILVSIYTFLIKCLSFLRDL